MRSDSLMGSVITHTLLMSNEPQLEPKVYRAHAGHTCPDDAGTGLTLGSTSSNTNSKIIKKQCFPKSQNKHKMKFDKKGVSKKADISSKVTLGNNVYIGAFTSICEGVTIGDNVKIHPNCYIGENVVIGDNCIIFPLVSIYHDCKLGVNNIVHSGVKIGSDGFGFAPNADNKYKKISHIGIVEIGDDVEIGSNTTIDRATMGSTKISNGVKLDNLIQIAHNVEIGENTVIAAQACVAGSTKIGKNCLIGGQVAISGHITVADQVKVAGQSGIASSVTEEGITIQGPMAFNLKQFQRSYILFKKLPEIYKTLNSIKDQFNV